MPGLVDSHCHLNYKKYNDDYREVISRSLEQGMKIVIPSSQLATSQRAVEIAKEFNDVYAAVALHPIHIVDEEFDDLEYLKLAKQPEVVGIGETGLDKFRIYAVSEGEEEAIFAKQIKVFKQHLEVAEAVNKPVIMHCREAYQEQLEVIMARGLKVKSVIHCFIGNREQVGGFLDFGSYVGFTGIITFKNVEPELLDVVKETPLDKILIETDSPYLAPVPHRGQRNEPLYVEFVARKIAEVKGISYEEVVEATRENAIQLFGLK
ncbi:MAG: TatD family hydrolase [bacterium]